MPLYFDVTFLSNSKQNKHVPSISGPITIISLPPKGFISCPNPFDEACHLIEIQYGEACIEDDIERTEYFSIE